MHGTMKDTMRLLPDAAASADLDTPRRPKRRRGVVALLMLAAFSTLAFRYLVPIPVDSTEAMFTAMPVTVAGPGLVEAKVTMSVSARVQARIGQITVDEGQRVAAGDLIAVLDQQDIQEQLRQSRFDSDAAKSTVTEAERQHASSTAVLSNARSDYERKAELLKRGVSTQAQVDASKATFEQALAQQQQAQAAIARSRAQLASTEAAAAIIESRLADGTVRAPLDGIVVSRHKSVGDILVPGQPIIEIVDPTSLVISARFDESAMEAVAEKQLVEVQFVSTSEVTFPGHVLRLGRSVDATTREFRVDVALDKLPAHWAVGQRATVRVTTRVKPGVTAVPSAYLVSNNGHTGVWIANRSKRAVWRPVQIGHGHNGLVEVTSGLSPGDRVVKGSNLFQLARITT
jgi:HlyD family secretion protein